MLLKCENFQTGLGPTGPASYIRHDRDIAWNSIENETMKQIIMFVNVHAKASK